MTSARVTLTAFELAVFDGAAKNCLTDEFVVTVFNDAMCPWLVKTVRRDWQHSLRNAQRKNCRHKLYKMRNLLLLLLLPHYRTLPHNRRILTATMYGHFAVYESLNSYTREHFCCGLLKVGGPISAFRFPPSHILKIRRHLVIFHAIIINNIVNTGYGA